VRRAIGDSVRIMIDANHAYDATAAIRLGRRIEALDIAWFENRCRPRTMPGIARSKRHC